MIRRFAVVMIGVLLLSLGTVLTATVTVPGSQAGLTVVPVDVGCTVPAMVTLAPSNMNRVSAAHHTLTARLSFPGGLAPGATVADIVLRLPGQSVSVSGTPGNGPYVFTFTREQVLSLVGLVNGDFTFEVSGVAGSCTFAAQDMLKITGPIR